MRLENKKGDPLGCDKLPMENIKTDTDQLIVSWFAFKHQDIVPDVVLVRGKDCK